MREYKKLPKMADFCHFFLVTGGARVAEGRVPHAPVPPLPFSKEIPNTTWFDFW